MTLDIDNNWWGTGVTLPDNSEVFDSVGWDPISATGPFPIPATP